MLIALCEINDNLITKLTITIMVSGGGKPSFGSRGAGGGRGGGGRGGGGRGAPRGRGGGGGGFKGGKTVVIEPHRHGNDLKGT